MTRRRIGAVLLAAGLLVSLQPGPAQSATAKPTVVLVHGAWAGSAVTEYPAGHLGLLSDAKTVTQRIERAARGRR